ncbi:MAG TPA: M18 family aminopeptidase [Deltaproteobacteria bacterium]|nr:M18 family aminopeptidase [Deltaproteobacteria bacterium]
MSTPLVERLLSFLDASPTPHHAVANSSALLQGLGFTEHALTDPPGPLPAGSLGYVRDEGSLFAFRIGTRAATESGWRVIAAHTDSPNLRIKPLPLQRSHGYVRLGVEVYGGVQVPTWVDRDLGIAGVVHTRDGQGVRSHLIEVRRPVARIPTLAIHLNREVNDKGLKLNKQTQLPAVFTLDEGPDPLLELLSEHVQRDPEEVLAWDLSLFDLTPAALGGAHEEFVFSARLDNLGSCHAALEALIATLDAEPPEATSVIALFDHEEVGSRSHRGADGRALELVLSTLLRDAGPQGQGGLSRALAHSWLVSADMAHALHPSFADKSDPEHAPRMNAGPAIKLNANQRYTSEGSTAARFALLCEQADVPHQWFLTRADMACGSTVGPLLASRLGVRGVDIGNPMLSMHSIREQCGAHDQAHMARAMQRFLVSPLT